MYVYFSLKRRRNLGCGGLKFKIGAIPIYLPSI
jgi:hypothetical protein